MSNQLYDRLKFVAQVLLPALGTLYFTLAGIWGLPAAEQVVGSIVAIDTFLGVLLHLSNTRYNKANRQIAGSLEVQDKPTGSTYNLVLDMNPDELQDKDQLVFKVNKS